jgi:hypothetical protein
MPPCKYITKDLSSSSCLSSKACAILLSLYFHVDSRNLIHKHKFIDKSGISMDSRTWNKYWRELEKNLIIAKAGIKTWMLSPHQCYTEGISKKSLIKQWETIIN